LPAANGRGCRLVFAIEKNFDITLANPPSDLYSHPPEKRKRKKKRNQNRSGKVYGRRNKDSGKAGIQTSRPGYRIL
jgi:hypothetical protein